MIQGTTDRKFRLRVTAIFSMAFVLLIANVAFAAWTANGDGTATADAKTAEDLTISPGNADELYPTGEDFDLDVTITNPNDYNVAVDKLVLDTSAANGGIDSGNATCNASHGVSYDADANGSWFVAANDSLNVALVDALDMSNASVDACQGLTFTIHLELGPASASTGDTADTDEWGAS